MQPLNLYKEERPWGNFLRFTDNEKSTVKIITVNSNQSLSLQSHKNRDEFWYILEGSGKVEIGNEHFDTKIGKEFFVPRNTKHRIESTNNTILKFLEIATGNFDEEDIERFDDKYGRISNKNNDK